jgi:hypothetical protein
MDNNRIVPLLILMLVLLTAAISVQHFKTLQTEEVSKSMIDSFDVRIADIEKVRQVEKEYFDSILTYAVSARQTTIQQKTIKYETVIYNISNLDSNSIDSAYKASLQSAYKRYGHYLSK